MSIWFPFQFNDSNNNMTVFLLQEYNLYPNVNDEKASWNYFSSFLCGLMPTKVSLGSVVVFSQKEWSQKSMYKFAIWLVDNFSRLDHDWKLAQYCTKKDETLTILVCNSGNKSHFFMYLMKLQNNTLHHAQYPLC